MELRIWLLLAVVLLIALAVLVVCAAVVNLWRRVQHLEDINYVRHGKKDDGFLEEF